MTKSFQPAQPRAALRLAGVRLLLATGLAVSLTLGAWAADTKKSFDVPAGDAASTLKQIAQQSGEQVVYPSQDVRGVKTTALKGDYTLREALDQILANTGLVAVFDEKSATFSVSKADPNGQRAVAKTADRPSQSSQAEARTDDNEHAQMMGVYEVKDRRPFTDANVDLVRTMNDPQPYYMFTAKAIEQSGATNVEDLLKTRLSMNAEGVAPSQQPGNSIGTSSGFNLRGLGKNQTVILINGRRFASLASVLSLNQADLNAIPMDAIERIDVLPTSSSAIYGGGAVGGVINVVLKRNYDGAAIRATYDNTTDTDSSIRTLDATFGMSLENGRTHLLIGAHYSQANALEVQDRASTIISGINRVLANNPAFLYTNTKPFYGATTNIGSATGANLTLKDGTPLNSVFTYVPAGFGAGSNSSGLVANAGMQNLNLAPGAAYPLGLGTYVGNYPTVKSVFISLRREFTPNLEVFVDYLNSSSFSLYKNASNFFGPYLVPSTAPTNPFQQNVDVRFPNAPASQTAINRDAPEVSAGFRASLPWGWRAEGDYTWSASNISSVTTNNVASAAFLADLANGTLNPFVDTFLHPLNLTPYVGPSVGGFANSMSDVGLRFAGPVGHLPAGEPSLMVGLEQRIEGFTDAPAFTTYPFHPEANATTLFLGKRQTVDSVSAETTIPVISSANQLPGVQRLDLQLAARSDSYATGIGTPVVSLASPTPLFPNNSTGSASKEKSTNPTVAILYEPVESVKLRGSYGTAFVVPSFVQLGTYAPAVTTTVTDPLRGNAIETIQYQNGGNPLLSPEKAKSWDAGIIFEPKAIKNLRLGLDWYQINKTDQIVSPTPQQIVNFESFFPGRVTRAPVAVGDPFGVGPIATVNATNVNFTKLKTNGFDLSAEYRQDTSGFGAFDFVAQGTIVEHFYQQPAPGATYLDYVNQVSLGDPGKLKINGGISWERGPWAAGWNTQYYGSYPTLAPPFTSSTAILLAQGSSRIPAQIYHDFFGGYRFGAAHVEAGTAESTSWHDHLLDRVEVKFGIRNAFNTKPPFDAAGLSSTGPYYMSPLGDPRLLHYWVSVKKSF